MRSGSAVGGVIVVVLAAAAVMAVGGWPLTLGVSALVLAPVVVGYVALDIRRWRDWFTPTSTFLLPWTLTIVLAGLPWTEKTSQSVDLLTYLFLIGSLGAFVLGDHLVRSSFADEVFDTAGSEGLDWNAYDPRRVGVASLLMAAVGVAVLGYMAGRDGIIRYALTDPYRYREEFGIRGLGHFARWSMIAVPLMVVSIRLQGTRVRQALRVLLVLSFLALGLRFTKFPVFFASITALIVWNYAGRRVTRKTLVMALAGLLVLFAVVNGVRTAAFGRMQRLMSEGTVVVPQDNPVLGELYLYLGTEVANVDHHVRDEPQLLLGRSTAKQIIAALPEGLRPTMPGLTGITRLSSQERTAEKARIYGLGVFEPFLIDLVRDFDLGGALTLSLLLGAASGYLYARFRRSASPLWATLWSVWAFCLLLSFIANYFTALGTWVVIFYVSVVYLWAHRGGASGGTGRDPGVEGYGRTLVSP